MTRRRWIADETSGDRAYLTGDHAAHLSRVLRAQVGQQFDVVANGLVHRARISNISPNRVEFELGEELRMSAVVDLSLLVSIFKFDRMEWAIEKSTELGVSRIFPVIARRSESHLATSAVKRRERWIRIAHEAAEQSRRVAAPSVWEPLSLKEALRQVEAPSRIVLDESERSSSLKDCLLAGNSERVALAFGPEGGWTEGEIQQFHVEGWHSASLGNTILRAETAVIAAVSVAIALLSPSSQS